MEKSKWAWLENKFKELCLPDFAKIANAIEKSLLDIYGRTSTPEWRSSRKGCEKGWDRCTTKTEKLFLLFTVMADDAFCIACKTDKLCLECRFGEVNGMCNEDESVFDTLGGKVGDLIDEGEIA